MGFLDAIMGNASEVDASDLAEELQPILASTETVDKVYKLIRDMYVFTNKRMIVIDKQGITGSKVEYHSVPYRAITQFKVETAGHFDLDAELTVFISGASEPLKIEMKADTAVGIQQTLAERLFA